MYPSSALCAVRVLQYERDPLGQSDTASELFGAAEMTLRIITCHAHNHVSPALTCCAE